MKLLLDENISRRILAQLLTCYPGSSHVSQLGLERSDDKAIWEFAGANGFVIVSKDEDFAGYHAVFGHPPRLIRLRMGNCDNNSVAGALTAHHSEIAAAFALPEVGLVEIG